MAQTTNSTVLMVENKILYIRGQRVILDADLAELYGVSTKALNQAVKRNRQRFPLDFMFQLTQQEKEEVVTNCDHLKKVKYSKVLPCAFTEHGAIMAATVLNSPQAMLVSIYVVRAFVHLRSIVGTHREVIHKLTELEQRIEIHDKSICSLFDAIRKLMSPQPAKPKQIGFNLGDEESK